METQNYKQSKIYKIIHPHDNHLYIGSTTSTLKDRLIWHKEQSKIAPERKIYKYILNNTNWDDWTIKLIEECEDIETGQDLRKKEESYRVQYDNSPLLLNSIRAHRTREQRLQTCHDYYHDNHEELIVKNREYYANNKEKITTQKCEYYIDNKEKILSKLADYRVKNKDKIKLANHKCYEKQKEDRLKITTRYRNDNQEKIKKTNKKHYEKNKQKLLEKSRLYHKTHSEEIAERHRKYCQTNKETLDAKRKEYYENNIDKIRMVDRLRYANNKEKRNASKKELIRCDVCNYEVSRGGMAAHRKSNKHQKNLAKNSSDNSPSELSDCAPSIEPGRLSQPH